MIKLILTKFGEQIIAGIKDFLDENGNPICYVLINPYVLNLIPSEELTEDGQPAAFTINYKKWVSCSDDVEYKIPYDLIATISNPAEQVLKSFTERFGELFNDDNTVPTTDSSDSPEGSGVSDSGDRGEGGEP